MPIPSRARHPQASSTATIMSNNIYYGRDALDLCIMTETFQPAQFLGKITRTTQTKMQFTTFFTLLAAGYGVVA